MLLIFGGAFAGMIGTSPAIVRPRTTMDSGYYAACSALMSRAQALDTIANNLANTSTSGFRAQHIVFQSVLAGLNPPSSSALNAALNDFGVLGGTRLDPGQGTLEPTANDLNLAIEGDGFFVVQTPGGKAYTRNGNFHVSARNQLVTAAGDPVLGEGGPVAVLGGPLSVSADGTISIAGALAGKLAVVEFPSGTAMAEIGQTYYSAPSGSARDAGNSHVRQGMLEGSNVNPVQGMVELVAVQREAEMMQRVLTLINGDLNKVATQDLPRVNV
jgi:flagellar basal-body rod protein FlgF